MASTLKTKVALGLGVMYIAWGTTYIGIAYAIESMPPLFSMALRFIVASFVLFVVIGFTKGLVALRVPRKQFFNATWLGVLMLTSGLGTMSLSEKVVPIGVASLIVAAMPIWTAIFRTIDRDRPGAWSLFGIASGLIGIAIIMLPGHTQARPDAGGGNVTFWMFVILFGNLCWSFGSFIATKVETPKDSFLLSAYEMAGAAVGLIIAGLLRHENAADFANATPRSWWGLIYLITIGSLVGYTVYTWLLDNASISLVSTYAYVNPVVAVALGILLFKEELTTNIIIGGVVVIISVAIVVAVESAKKQKVVKPQEFVA